ncbi:MAG: GNAT family N-acetyltransferase [Terracidiphilus sp.]
MSVEFRACKDLDEFEACVQIQIATWGYDESDLLPRRSFLLAQKIGGQVMGAFEVGFSNGLASGAAGTLVGFALSLPGVKIVEGKPYPYLHSHMLAVLESHRNQGLGAQLKWHQRGEALARGIRRMEWTFDPLEIKNAFLNIHRLGAVVREYRVNFYGVSSSRLQAGLPTDRLLAEWELDSQRVEDVFARRPAVAGSIEERILVPALIDQWKASEATRERALAVQLENQQKFQQAFSRGLAVLDFSRDTDGNGVYELGPYSQP